VVDAAALADAAPRELGLAQLAGRDAGQAADG
jgi:hypothetical protein